MEDGRSIGRGCIKKQAAATIDVVMDAIKGSLAEGEKVSLVGFGSFEVKQRKARSGRNPQTGKKIRIKAKKVPRGLKDAMN